MRERPGSGKALTPLPAAQERSCRGCLSGKAGVCDSFILRAGTLATRLASRDPPEGEPGWSDLVVPSVLSGLSLAEPRFSPCCVISFWNSSFLVCKLVKGGEIQVVPTNLRLCVYSPRHAPSVEGPSTQLCPPPWPALPGDQDNLSKGDTGAGPEGVSPIFADSPGLGHKGFPNSLKPHPLRHLQARAWPTQLHRPAGLQKSCVKHGAPASVLGTPRVN